MIIVVMSCDKYKSCWKPFFTLLDKYWGNHPKAVLVCETEECPYCETINIPSDIWTTRLRKALEVIKDEEGMQNMRILAKNLAWFLKCKEAGQKTGLTPPAIETPIMTNFIR